MTRHRRIAALLALGCLAASRPGPASGQLAPRPPLATPPASARPVDIMRAAIATNPITAPYPIEVFERGGRVVLRGVVGTKVIYDAAVRTAIASGIPFADELVIDTLAAHDVAAQGAAAAAAAAGPFPPVGFPTYGATGGYPPPTYMPFGPAPGGAPGLIYPPPLFGRVDEPFFGLEPPVISYPPYWGALSARRLAEYGASSGAGPGSGAAPFPEVVEPPPGTVDVQIDPNGVATLRGSVPTMADRIAVGQHLARTPGVSQVINLLRVEAAPGDATGTRPDPVTPPSPTPIPPRPLILAPPGPRPGPAPEPRPDDDAAPDPPEIAPPVDAPAPDPAPGPDDHRAAIPGLEGLPVRVSVDDGRATLEGEVATALEAMNAYLAVKRHPGVVEVVDRLRFSVPIEPAANPLRSADDPLDVEEYLGDQVRRQLDGLARVDRVRLFGDRLEVQGRLDDPDDLRRAEATLRSTPVLRGFSLATHFVPGA